MSPENERDWLADLVKLVEARSLVLLRFGEHDWDRLRESRHGISEFTLVRPHAMLDGVKAPTACLVTGGSGAEQEMFLGVISSRKAVATLDSRIKIRRALEIEPSNLDSFRALITDRSHATNLAVRLKASGDVIVFSPRLGGYTIQRLASLPANRGPMRAVAAFLSGPRRFSGAAALQDDAIRVALKAFGLSTEDAAESIELVPGRETALARALVLEDSVVEHDARSIPGFQLFGSDLTGRAVFRRQSETLEVFTANKRPLEQVFGVDLIYLNTEKQNVVMVQYKMLERTGSGRKTDWLYRPDSQLTDELNRMRRFRSLVPGDLRDYRLNPEMFYLKFVKRDSEAGRGGIVTPLAHFESLAQNPANLGPRGGLRVSYNSLSGRYLRQEPFLELIRSGYIGSHAETTEHLRTLIDAVLRGDRALVTAIKSTVPDEAEANVDDDIDLFMDDDEL